MVEFSKIQNFLKNKHKFDTKKDVVKDIEGIFTPTDIKKQMDDDSVNYTRLLYQNSKKVNSSVIRVDRVTYISRVYLEIVSNSLREKVFNNIKSQGFVIENSNGNLIPNVSTKENIRKIHNMARKHKLDDYEKFLQKRESKLINYFANGDDIDIDNIEPTVHVINGGGLENDLFRYASLLWSIPVSNGYGRRVRFVVFDKYNDNIIGIFAL